jgi:hypothetical protein
MHDPVKRTGSFPVTTSAGLEQIVVRREELSYKLPAQSHLRARHPAGRVRAADQEVTSGLVGDRNEYTTVVPPTSNRRYFWLTFAEILLEQDLWEINRRQITQSATNPTRAPINPQLNTLPRE